MVLSNLPLNLEEFKKKAKLRISDDRYNVYDLNWQDGLTASLTELYPRKSTRGHSHGDIDEIYHFLRGSGELEFRYPKDLGKEIDLESSIKHEVTDNEIIAIYPVEEGSSLKVERGVFHRVHNRSDKLLIFVTEASGYVKRIYG